MVKDKFEGNAKLYFERMEVQFKHVQIGDYLAMRNMQGEFTDFDKITDIHRTFFHNHLKAICFEEKGWIQYYPDDFDQIRVIYRIKKLISRK